VFANGIEREEQNKTNECERTKDLKLVRQPPDPEAVYYRPEQKGQQGAYYDRQNKTT
jgi:hypothetical protein